MKAGTTYRIGRDPKSDIVMTDSRVSWQHGELLFDGGAWIIKDLGSTNGTFLGLQRLDRIEIGAECVVRLGNPDDGPVLRCVPQVPAADHPGTALSASPAQSAPPVPESAPREPAAPRDRLAPPESAAPRDRPAPPGPAAPRDRFAPPEREPAPRHAMAAAAAQSPAGRAGPAAERGPQAHGADAAAG